MKNLIVLILLLISTSANFAQTIEQQVAKIRQTYAETNRRIEAGAADKTQGFHYAAWSVGGERDGQQWAAVGAMKTSAEFWFDGEPNGASDGKPQEARRMIRKIVSTYAAAADLRTRSEYFFDESGVLIFAFTTELDADGKTVERRFYYARGKLIRVARDGKNFDGKFANEDLQLAANAQTDAKRLQNIFALIFSE